MTELVNVSAEVCTPEAATEVRQARTTPYKHLSAEEVLTVHHWTDRLFSFTLTRDPSFRFENGQFVMIGLEVDGRPLLRAYSIASPNYEETLEFLSIKVPDGPLTSRLQKIVPGDTVLVGRKPVGTLLVDNLKPGRNCYFLSTGTGLAPFLSLIRDPNVYDRFEKVILVHGCRQVSELAYSQLISEDLHAHEYIGEMVRDKLIYYPTVTREPFRNQGRATDLISSGKLMADLGLPPLDPELDRAMICGSEAMLADTKAILEGLGFEEGNSSQPGAFVYEKAFAEK
jgi:ferredoxin/flavodoxin---NADP+ reductase